jgi:GH43 family beta-xylosidase
MSANADPMNAASWRKSKNPVFTPSPSAHAYDIGQNGFFKAPDGQDWIVYHANSEPGRGCGNQRSPRAQPFGWNADGTPNFGNPIPTGKPLPEPK